MAITLARAAAGRPWRVRALEATHGNQSQLGAILIAVLGRAPDHPPRFGSGAVITTDGHVLAHFQTRDGEWHHGAYVATVQEINDNFRGLADHLKLSDADRVEMFDELRKWFVTDYRATALDENNRPKETRQ